MEQKDSQHKDTGVQEHQPFVFTSEHANNWALTGLIVVIIIALGLFALNQFVQWRYNNYFLRGPCQMCIDLNPDVKQCWQMEKVLYNNSVNNSTHNMTSIFNEVVINGNKNST